MSVIEGTGRAGEGNSQLGQGRLKVLRGDYDFAADGGVVGTINLGAELPIGAIVLGGFMEVETVPTSGGAPTIAVTLEAANDLIAAAAISGAPWSTVGRKSVIPAFTGTTSLKTTAARQLAIVIGTANLTAGKFKVVLFYLEPLP